MFSLSVSAQDSECPHSLCIWTVEEEKAAQDEAGATHAEAEKAPSEVRGRDGGKPGEHRQPSVTPSPSKHALTWSPGFGGSWRGASLCLVYR